MSIASTRLYATFVMMRSTPQERLVYDILKELGVNVTELEPTARAHECTFAIFVNPTLLRKPTRVSSKSVRFARVSTGTNSPSVLGMTVPDWAEGAQGCVALNPLGRSINFRTVRSSLKDALRASCRLCTQRVRQIDMQSRKAMRAAATRQKAA
jgi:hypothetical protein